MRIPGKIKVGAHEYKVLYPYKWRERSDYSGQCDNSLLELRIDESDQCGVKRADSKIIGTLIHEVLHAISETWEIKLEEDQVLRLEEGILAVLNDNNYLQMVIE